jgi:cytoskeleton protein RodZ
MSDLRPEPDSGGADSAGSRTAGAMLKAARQRAGLHVAVLAATIKVAPAKLEALEQDRYDQLPNATFTRALAQSVCRSLKVDPRPVLALLPQVEAPALEGSAGRLNTPFQDRPSRTDGSGLAWASKPMFWAGGLLLLAAVVVGMVPPDLVQQWMSSPPPVAVPASAPASAGAAVLAPDPAASARITADPSAAAPAPLPESSVVAASAVVTGATPAPMPAPSAPVAVAAPKAEAVPAVAGDGRLRLVASADSWIEVIGPQGQPVFSRILQRGEAVVVDAPPPLRMRIGNAAGTSVAFRGQAFDLAPYTRDNVARVELR